jgi:hypothetical protein
MPESRIPSSLFRDGGSWLFNRGPRTNQLLRFVYRKAYREGIDPLGVIRVHVQDTNSIINHAGNLFPLPSVSHAAPPRRPPRRPPPPRFARSRSSLCL